MIPSPLHPLLGNVIAMLMIFGTVMVGSIILKRFFNRDNFALSLALGMVLISQCIYITTLHPFTLLLIYPVAWMLFGFGVVYIYIFSNKLSITIPKTNPYSWLIVLISAGFLLFSLCPPTMTDALDYHLGIPIYLLRHREWPPTTLWLHGSAGGIGEIYNTLGISIKSDNLGTILQCIGLLSFIKYLTDDSELDKKNFIYMFILSSPILLQLLTGPKPQLFPQILTALSLHIILSNKKLQERDFVLILIFVMGATQQKIPFLITGGILTIYAMWKSRFFYKKAIIYSIILSIYFFIPRGLWNLSQDTNNSLLGFFYTWPQEVLNSVSINKENHFTFPINLFIPDSLGTITTVLGLNIFLIFLVKSSKIIFKEGTIILILVSFIIYFLSQPIARYYYELHLWVAVIFSYLNKNEIDFKKYINYSAIYGVIVLVMLIFGVSTQITGIFSQEQKIKVMHEQAYLYSAIDWINNFLPDDAVVISQLRSVSFYKNKFVPMDWLPHFQLLKLNKNIRNEYIKRIKESKPKFIAILGDINNKHPFYNCIEGNMLASNNFQQARRNPFNMGESYQVQIYKFNYMKLPKCSKLF